MKTAAFTRGQVEAWLQAQTLPGGPVACARTTPLARMKVATPSEVIVWAVALGVQVEIGYGEVSTVACRPVALPGWELEIYCAAPVVAADVRIEVAR